MIGVRFQKLVVVAQAESRDGKRQWVCRCDCGRETVVSGVRLRKGQVSCGVVGCRPGTGHGLSKKSRAYVRWKTIKARCLNPKHDRFPDYGGKGITICERWLRFENFLEDMGEPPPGTFIDRIKNELGYYPGNCRWVSPKVSTENRRNTVYLQGLRIEVFAQRSGLPASLIYQRRLMGWRASDISLAPVPHGYDREGNPINPHDH